MLSTIGCVEGEVNLYDSYYTSTSSNTDTTIAHLLRCKKQSITINTVGVTKQKGTQDCALFAISFLTAICFSHDPSMITFDQDEMRPHLINCFEKRKMTPFPFKTKRKKTKDIVNILPVYCHCRLPDNGETMICCDNCSEWYHAACIECSDQTTNWYCNKCKMKI